MLRSSVCLGPGPIQPAALDLKALMVGEVEEAFVDEFGPDHDLAHEVGFRSSLTI